MLRRSNGLTTMPHTATVQHATLRHATPHYSVMPDYTRPPSCHTATPTTRHHTLAHQPPISGSLWELYFFLRFAQDF